MAKIRREADIEQTFYEAEQTGLKLAIRVRTVALILLGLFLGISRSPDPTHALELVAGVGGFVALDGIHYVIVGSRFDRKWVKYIFVSIDIAILSILVAPSRSTNRSICRRRSISATSSSPIFRRTWGIRL